VSVNQKTVIRISCYCCISETSSAVLNQYTVPAKREKKILPCKCMHMKKWNLHFYDDNWNAHLLCWLHNRIITLNFLFWKRFLNSEKNQNETGVLRWTERPVVELERGIPFHSRKSCLIPVLWDRVELIHGHGLSLIHIDTARCWNS
jgi:hypothetical protein